MLKQLKIFYYFYETEIANTSATSATNYTIKQDFIDEKTIDKYSL
jgi:hypothetical protein